MQGCSLSPGASTGTVSFQNSATLFLALEIGNYSKIYLIPDLVCIDHYPSEISFLSFLFTPLCYLEREF